MSLNVQALSVKKVIDPRLEINEDREYLALKGALVNSWQQFPATNVNNSSFQITCNPPSRDIAISRLVLKKVVFDIQIVGSTGGPNNLLVEGYHAPRALPLTSVTQSESITINNDTVTQAPVQQYWRALMRYRNDFKDRFGVGSLCPSMLDQFQDYIDGVNTVRNPLDAYGNSSFDETRGSYTGYEVLTNTPTGATLRLTTIEPILISPMAFGDRANYMSCFTGVQNMSYNCTLGNLSRVLSLIQGQGATPAHNITSVSVNISSASLLFNYLTPDPVVSPIPRNTELSYFSIVSYPTRHNVSVPVGGTASITMQSIQVSSIPKRIYVFAKRDDSGETPYTSDSYFGLVENANPITMTWNNNQFLSQATTQDVYNMAVKNGCNMSYSQFVRQIGSVCAFDFGSDIGLASNQSAGSIGNYQLSLTVQVKNLSKTESITPTLYVVVVYEGVFNINDGACSHMVGILSPSDVLNAEALPVGSYRESQDVYGGSFWSSIRDYAKKHKLISRGLALIPNPYAQAGSKAAKVLGYGASGGGLSGGSLANLCEE